MSDLLSVQIDDMGSVGFAKPDGKNAANLVLQWHDDDGEPVMTHSLVMLVDDPQSMIAVIVRLHGLAAMLTELLPVTDENVSFCLNKDKDAF